jgi:putative cell wall-binding protein
MIQPELMKRKGIRGFPLYIGLAAAGLLALAGCAATPEAPMQELQAAELAIASAEQERVADYASDDLNQAREKLAAARRAVRNEQPVQARYLAEESRVKAVLASAKAEEAKAKAINDEMRESIETLKEEMRRNPGER